MAETLQRTLMMGVDETGEPVPMPIREDGNSSAITTIPALEISDVPSLDIATMPALTITDATGATKRMLSGSTNGKAIKVVETATAGTLLHTAIAGTTQVDYVELWAVNTDTTDRKLTLEWGEATAPDGNIEITIPAEDGLVQLLPDGGLMLQNGLTIKAFAAAANVICIHGRVTRRTLNA
jgi:hypothetical protein